jgi:hypothetical protein
MDDKLDWERQLPTGRARNGNERQTARGELDNMRIRGRFMRGIVQHVIAALLCGVLTGTAMAQQQPVDSIARANQGAVGVITGMEGGTCARTGADLTILDSDTLRVLPALGKGSLQNLSDILYLSSTLSKNSGLTVSSGCERLFPPGRSRGLVRG